jgi:molybdopterin synthase catalytic subunit
MTISNLLFLFIQVLCLEYEAYEAMALKSMNSICTEIRLRWTDVKHIGMHHRLGKPKIHYNHKIILNELLHYVSGVVPVKEASVVIAISSPHRKSSLQAVQYAIEELKKSVPVWKKETYSDPAGSSSEWKENSECKWSTNYKSNHIL